MITKHLQESSRNAKVPAYRPNGTDFPHAVRQCDVMPSQIAMNLRRLMIRKNLRGNQLAKASGVSESTISMYKNDRVFDHDVGILNKIGAALGVYGADLLDSTDIDEAARRYAAEQSTGTATMTAPKPRRPKPVPLYDPMLGRQIKAARKLAGLTLDALAEAADVDADYLSQVERGHQVGVDTGTRRQIGQALVDSTQSMHSLPEWAEPARILSRTIMVPVLGPASAGASLFRYQDVSELDENIEWVHAEGTDRVDDAFAVVVDGDSMIPRLPEGARAVCIRIGCEGYEHFEQQEMQPGKMVHVVFSVDSDRPGESGLYEWHPADDGSEITLKKANPAYDSITVQPEHIERLALVWSISARV